MGQSMSGPINLIKKPIKAIVERLAERTAQRVVETVSASGLAGDIASIAAWREKLAYDVSEIAQCRTVTKIAQILLSLKYKELLHNKLLLPQFRDVEFRCCSQNGEDGILLYIFSILGTTNQRCVEVCAGDGVQCNTANFIINHGWDGLLFDGNEELITSGRNYYANCKDTLIQRPTLVHAWITVDNINSLIRSNGFEGDIDLLSLDMDGMDYWVWKAIDCMRPRVVVLECRSEWGPERSVTVPYKPDFAIHYDGKPWYGGASLPAFVKLGRQKGYRLVGSICHRFNAFFIRTGIGEDVFPEVPVSKVLGENVDLSWVNPNWEWVEV